VRLRSTLSSRFLPPPRFLHLSLVRIRAHLLCRVPECLLAGTPPLPEWSSVLVPSLTLRLRRPLGPTTLLVFSCSPPLAPSIRVWYRHPVRFRFRPLSFLGAKPVVCVVRRTHSALPLAQLLRFPG